jgi:hypothetical protein
MRRLSWALVSLLVFAALLAQAPGTARAVTIPDVINLPNGWLPEGIVTGDGPVIYSGSRANGAVYAADLRTGQGAILVPGQAGRIAVGLSYDARTNYIFVAGGNTGKAWIYDADTGAEVREYTLTAAGTFINDVIVTFDGAYFTNSNLAVYYRVPLGPDGQPADPADVETIPLSGEWQQVAGFNANGIEATGNGKTLVIVNSTSGVLYSVDALTGVASLIDLGGASVSMGDGLLLLNRTIFVMRNRINELAVFELAPDLSSGVLVRTITQSNFDVPTTIAKHANQIYVVNARFTTPPTPTTPYTIVRVTAER